MLQDLLQKSHSKLKRVLFDNNIKVMGEEVNCLRITLTYDPDFPDDKVMQIDKAEVITAVISFPGDILPMYDINGDYTNNNTNNNQNVFYLYNVLPITAYFKFADEIKLGDIIVYKRYNELGNASPIVFQVTRLNGEFRRYENWREYIIALHHLDLIPEVKILINDYMTNTDY